MGVLRNGNPYSEVWYEDFPWTWMDEVSSRAIYFNLENYPYDITDVRWALALAINMEDVVISGFSGINRMAPFSETFYYFLVLLNKKDFSY
jgi:Bacterial extracellular solute-binding proteins, family 5 Middle.